MTSIFLDIMKYPTRHKAKNAAPWAYKIKKCYFGWTAFQNMKEYDEYMIEERKEKYILRTRYK